MERENKMAKGPVFLFLGAYSDKADARADLEVVRDLHAVGTIGTYDAAIAVKELDGSVKVEKHEKPTQHGAWGGIAVGAVVGILFPPSLLVGAAVGGVTGGLIGHFWRGMSRKDVKELGELLDAGDALLIVIGKDTLQAELDKAGIKAEKQIEKQLDMDSKEIDKEISELQKELAKS
jgi:uncharacterized membrane protein